MLDTIIKNGHIVSLICDSCTIACIRLIENQVTATEVLPLGIEIGIKDGRIALLGYGLDAGPDTTIVDAEGAYITPGCVSCFAPDI